MCPALARGCVFGWLVLCSALSRAESRAVAHLELLAVRSPAYMNTKMKESTDDKVVLHIPKCGQITLPRKLAECIVVADPETGEIVDDPSADANRPGGWTTVVDEKDGPRQERTPAVPVRA